MRPIWSGTISFGLVKRSGADVPATESKELRFHFLDKKDLTPIAYEKVPACDRERVDAERDRSRLRDREGALRTPRGRGPRRLDIELTHSIDIMDFVDLDEIDPVYFRKAYYSCRRRERRPVSPARPRARGDGQGRDREGVIRNKRISPCAPDEGRLLLETITNADEVRSPQALDGELGTARLQNAEVEMAKSLVENLSEPFKPDKVRRHLAKNCST